MSTRRTSVYTLEFVPAQVMPGAAERQLDLTIKRLDTFKAVTRVGSGSLGEVRYVMFRTTDDTEASALANLLCHTAQGKPRFKSHTLSTGQGTHHRTISLKENTMATKYIVTLDDGSTAGTRSQKNAAIKLGDESGQGYRVTTSSGAVVHQIEAPQPENTKKENDVTTTEDDDIVGTPAPKKTAAKPKPKKEEPTYDHVKEVKYDGAASYYFRSLGVALAEKIGAVHGVEVADTVPGSRVIKLGGAKEDVDEVINRLRSVWGQAMALHKAWRKSDAAYSEISKDRKDKDANAARWAAEVAWFDAFTTGAADAEAGTPKRKAGAYKDGVNAVTNPAEDDVI